MAPKSKDSAGTRILTWFLALSALGFVEFLVYLGYRLWTFYYSDNSASEQVIAPYLFILLGLAPLLFWSPVGKTLSDIDPLIVAACVVCILISPVWMALWVGSAHTLGSPRPWYEPGSMSPLNDIDVQTMVQGFISIAGLAVILTKKGIGMKSRRKRFEELRNGNPLAKD